MSEQHPPARPRRRHDHVLAVGIAAVVVGLLGWTAYLAVSLPHHYNARNWNLMWVGFDVALSFVLAVAAWAAWFRRRVMVVTALVAGTLLLCDAWFDVLSSLGNSDAWLTLLTALAGEIPLALFLFWLARRILVGVVATVHRLSGAPGPPPRVREVLATPVGPFGEGRARTGPVSPRGGGPR